MDIKELKINLILTKFYVLFLFSNYIGKQRMNVLKKKTKITE